MLRRNDLPLYMALVIIMLLAMAYLSTPMKHKERGQEKALAKVISFTNNLKFKRNNNLAWVDLNGPKLLREGDKLFTHENARARIKYSNGVDIEIEPSTLLKISEKKGTTIIDIQMGYITLSFKEAEKNVIVNARDESITIDASKSKLNVIEVDSFLAVNVTKGRAKIKKSTTNKRLTVKKGELLTPNNTIVKIDKLPTTLKPKGIERIYRIVDQLPDTLDAPGISKEFKVISPENLSNHFLYGENVEIAFDWIAETSSSKFIVSKYPDLSMPYIETNTNIVRPIKYEFNELGVFYWRVGDSPRQTFRILKNPPLPKPEITKFLDLRNLSKEKELYRIKWKPVKYASSYLLEIYKDPLAKKLLARTMVERASVLWTADIVDSSYYRVTAIDRWNEKGEPSDIGKLIAPISPFEKILKKDGN